jgi:Xaa-Pro aminopeptidase
MNKALDLPTLQNLAQQMPQTTTDKIAALRESMGQHGMNAWLLPKSDPHGSEYLAPRWESIKWLTGFSGSAGTVVILQDKAAIWVDGRYHLQVEEQLAGSGITIFKVGLPDVPEINTWLKDELAAGSCVGFDGALLSAAAYDDIFNELKSKSIFLKTDLDLIDNIWQLRPTFPDEKIFEHAVSFAGKSRAEKLAEVRQKMNQDNADWLLLNTLDDIAWLFNFRGSDTPKVPVALCYALISKDKAWLCIDKHKVPAALKNAFREDGVIVAAYPKIFKLASQIPAGDAVFIDRNSVNSELDRQLHTDCKRIDKVNIVARLKAIKNSTEIEHFKKCLVRDGIHVLEFMKWLEDNIGRQEITELAAAAKLKSLRQRDEHFHGLSFSTIAGYGANGAKMHYTPSAETETIIGHDSFLLLDSGGQYSDGTTDITRTFSFGELTEQQINDYTLVIKAHINMARAVFIEGTRGTQIDYAARAEMWRQGIHYQCATGHGVGFFLNVHEGPQNIGQRFVDEALLPGMIITNEPGVYRQGHHGVRLENIMLCQEDQQSEFGNFYGFETVTVCPIETRGIDLSQLTSEEITWLNDYHAMVYEKMAPQLDEEHRIYLKEKTKTLKH